MTKRTKGIAGGPTVASLAVGAVLTVATVTGTVWALFTGNGLAYWLGLLASVMVTHRTIEQGRVYRRMSGITVVELDLKAEGPETLTKGGLSKPGPY